MRIKLNKIISVPETPYYTINVLPSYYNYFNLGKVNWKVYDSKLLIYTFYNNTFYWMYKIKESMILEYQNKIIYYICG